MAGVEQRLLDFSQPFDVNLLDQLITTLYTGTNETERLAANQILSKFTEHPDAWTRVDQILERAQRVESKFLGLRILQNCILQRWKILPEQQRKGIKDYVVNAVIRLSSDPVQFRQSKTYLIKLDEVLIQIVKQEWPTQWPNFVSEIVASAQSSETLCENNLIILRMLSEEVFDFSTGQMTQRKIADLKNQFNADFSKVFQLCELIFQTSQNVSLLTATLQTLHRFLNWIPLGYIFETPLIDILITKFLGAAPFRTLVLMCLSEIGGLELDVAAPAYAPQLRQLFARTVGALSTVIPPTLDLAKVYDEGSDEDSKFVHALGLFLTTFLRTHGSLVETAEAQGLLMQALDWLVRISRVQDKEVFKMCLEYWLCLAKDLFHKDLHVAPAPAPVGFGALMQATPRPPSARLGAYQPVLSQIRRLVINRMAKPEEVLIVEDEDGQVRREWSKDTDTIVLYKTMRECLIFLTHLDPKDTERIINEKLRRIISGEDYSFTSVNTLSWSVGAIAAEDDERQFVVEIIRELLGLCENRSGKENKAVIASNIMFVVAQYPRFLRAHWRFLKTVANKLFEFMKEPFPGVQDMACDTFLQIAQKCRRKFAVLQVGETMPFINEVIMQLNNIISDLQPAQVHTVYEALAVIISAQNPPHRDFLVKALFATPNEMWRSIMTRAAQSLDVIRAPDTQQTLLNILQTNTRVAAALGNGYAVQLGTVFLDALNLYKAYNGIVAEAVAAGGLKALHSTDVRQMRAIKREILRLVEAFIEHSEDTQAVSQTFLPPLLESILADYQNSIPEVRDAEVLVLLTQAINRLRGLMQDRIPAIFAAVFECTLSMITKNFEDFPEHRVAFFNLLRATNQHCFPAFRQIPGPHFKLVVDSIIWAFKHADRNIADIGLNLLLELLRNVHNSDLAVAFYQAYYIPILQDLFYVLTDTFHKPGFKLHATILLFMFRIVRFNQIAAPLAPHPETLPAGSTNEDYVRQVLTDLLARSFPNLLPAQIALFVQGLFTIDDLTLFKNHLRDFLVQLKEFAGDTNDLFLEEMQAAEAARNEQQRKQDMQVPGLLSLPSVSPDDD